MRISIPKEAFTSRPTSDSTDAYAGIQKAKADLYSDTGQLTQVGDYSYQQESFMGMMGNNGMGYRQTALPARYQEIIIGMCMMAYDRIGIVRNVIDLMGDFACQGIDLVHPNKQIEKFYRKWFKKINGKDRCERFLNLLYRTGNVIVTRHDAKIPTPDIDEWRKAYGGSMDVEFDKIKTSKNVIPAKYVMHHPLAIEMVGGELGAFMGMPIFGLRITPGLKQMVNEYGRATRNPEITGLYNDIPPGLFDAIQKGAKYLPMDQDKVSVYHYKKDDWLMWANPMLHAVLNDLKHFEKLQEADMAALEGSTSSVRLWNLGILDKENSIFPTRIAINKLRDILAQNRNGSTLDLVWGPELSFKESSSNSFQYLGPDKYQITLGNIYTGLGIPPALVGGSKDGGFTNNYISIKTLIERLQYGRDVLKTWLCGEIERVQKAMGFRFPAQITFDQLIMSDEAAEKALLIQLIDRNVISDEAVRDRFDLNEEIEKIRIKRENSEKKTTGLSKMGAFSTPDKDHELKKLAMQRGNVTPTEVGLDLPSRKEGEKTPLEQQHEQQVELAKTNNQAKIAQQKNTPSKVNGRPKNKKDGTKRKTKRILPRTKGGLADINTWAVSAQKTISDTITPVILGSLSKTNARMLTNEESENLETLKFDILCSFEPFSAITAEKVYSILDTSSRASQDVIDTYYELLTRFIKFNVKDPNLDEKRQIMAMAYSLNNEEDDEQE